MPLPSDLIKFAFVYEGLISYNLLLQLKTPG